MATRPTAARGKTTKKESIKRRVNKLRDKFGKLPKPKKMSPGESMARFGTPTVPKSKLRKPLKPFRKLAGALPSAGASLRKAAEQLKKAKKGMKRGGKAK